MTELLHRLRSMGPRGRRTAALVIPLAVFALMLGLVIVSGGPARNSDSSAGESSEAFSGNDELEVGADPATGVPGSPSDAAAFSGSASPGAGTSGRSGAATDITVPAASTPLPGVKGNEITVAYYWKGDRTRTSPYLAGSGFETNLDEGKSFRALIDYINRHADGGATLMGFPFDLHGKKLVPVVLEAGNSPEEYAAVGRRLVEEVKPAIAVSAHGSLSAYVCPQLARAGIHNLSTFDLETDLAGRTGGYCTPLGASWDRQAEASVNYISGRMSKSSYSGPEGSGPRKFGVIWAEYPGLNESARRLIANLKSAGVEIAATATLSDSLTEAQQQAGNAIARMRAAGVNTIIFPDSGAPLSFTQAAETQQYRPDYYVWPCSGQDLTAMVRLFNANQWERAQGLSCYDSDFQTDLANDSHSTETEWYRQYRSVRNEDPPASTGLVYQSLLPLVVGLTNSGGDLTVGAFRKAIAEFDSYRYSAVTGRTSDAKRLLLDIGSSDRSLIGDFTEVAWSMGARAEGSSVPGTYEYPGDQKRYPASYRW